MPRRKGVNTRKKPRDFHKEYLDPTPIEIPVAFQQAEPLRDSIKRMVREEFSVAAKSSEMETFEEADDFNMSDDEEDFLSPYEIVEMADEEESETIEDPLVKKASQEDEAEPRTVVDPDTPNQAGAENTTQSTETSATPQ